MIIHCLAACYPVGIGDFDRMRKPCLFKKRENKSGKDGKTFPRKKFSEPRGSLLLRVYVSLTACWGGNDTFDLSSLIGIKKNQLCWSIKSQIRGFLNHLHSIL